MKCPVQGPGFTYLYHEDERGYILEAWDHKTRGLHRYLARRTTRDSRGELCAGDKLETEELSEALAFMGLRELP